MSNFGFGLDRPGWARVILAALVLAGAGASGPASAQQPGSKSAPAVGVKNVPQPPAAGVKGSEVMSGWKKICKTAGVVKKDKAGKDEAKDVRVCLTANDWHESKTGKVVFSAAIRQVGGDDKQFFMVTVPLGMMLQAGVRGVVFPKDLWAKAQKNEKVDESKLKAIALKYMLCHPGGCDSELELTPELINDLETGGGVMIYTINANGGPVGYALPLAGLDAALAESSAETYRATIVVPKK
jgi:invasion protein IalB